MKGRSQVYAIPVSAEHFKAVKANQMLFQVCQDDECLSMGDHLVLQETDAEMGLSGAVIACVITYKQLGGALGIGPGYCVLGLYKPGAISPLVITPKKQR